MSDFINQLFGEPIRDDLSLSNILFKVPEIRGNELLEMVGKILKDIDNPDDMISFYDDIINLTNSEPEAKWVIYLFGAHSIRIKQLYIINQHKRLL